MVELDVLNRVKSTVFILQMALKASEECPEELGSYSSLFIYFFFILLLLFFFLRAVIRNSLRNLFISRLAFQNKKLLG